MYITSSQAKKQAIEARKEVIVKNMEKAKLPSLKRLALKFGIEQNEIENASEDEIIELIKNKLNINDTILDAV